MAQYENKIYEKIRNDNNKTKDMNTYAEDTRQYKSQYTDSTTHTS